MNNITQTPLEQFSSTMPPAQLWIGTFDFLHTQVMQYLQQIMCPHKACNVCAQCRMIMQKQHHSIMWISPEKNYTLDDLAILFTTISYALNPGEHIFFIMDKADSLTLACANSLLKSIEEPPAGYHFILLAQNQEHILPTIRSRCIIQSFYGTTATPSNALFAFFSAPNHQNPFDFTTALDQSKIHERESLELLDQLIIHWMNHYKKAIESHDASTLKKASAMMKLFMDAAQFPPMPGSSKIFWKNLFLQTKKALA